MAVSPILSTVRPTPQALYNFKSPKPKPIPKSSSSYLCSVSSTKQSDSYLPPPPNQKKQLSRVTRDFGVGLLAAAAVLAVTPLDAVATRIEYYATVAEPSCDLNFAPSGLGYCDVSVGSGQVVPYAELINIHYTARFADGIVFDSSYKRARPLTMRLGLGKVIRGLDQGILGGEGIPPMQVGGRRRLQIPPQLAYGPEPAGCFSGDCNIPANATLLYDINFVDIYSGNRKK